MSKVFVAQAGRNLDYAQAEKFGEVVFILSAEEEHNPAPYPTSSNAYITSAIKRALQDYQQGEDYIMLTGNPLPGLIIGSYLNRGLHKILKWKNRDKCYRLHELEIRE